MKIILKIKRFNPESDEKPYFQEYTVETNPTDRLLDAIMHIKRFQDGTLGFRKSCAHGVCGSDAMRINGKDGLACKTLIKDVATQDGDAITIEPLQYFAVQRDLIVDQTEFFETYIVGSKKIPLDKYLKISGLNSEIQEGGLKISLQENVSQGEQEMMEGMLGAN